MTFVVWVLFISACGYGSCSPVIVDNIASRQNCEALARSIDAQFTGHRCIAVRKVRP